MQVLLEPAGPRLDDPSTNPKQSVTRPAEQGRMVEERNGHGEDEGEDSETVEA